MRRNCPRYRGPSEKGKGTGPGRRRPGGRRIVIKLDPCGHPGGLNKTVLNRVLQHLRPQILIPRISHANGSRSMRRQQPRLGLVVAMMLISAVAALTRAQIATPTVRT